MGKYNSEDTYFIKKSGEIYECKFQQILVKIGRQNNILDNIQEGVFYVVLNVADVEEVIIPYARWISKDDWNALNIYSTLQDCIASRNPLFYSAKDTWAFSEPLSYCYKDIKPTNASWVVDNYKWVLQSYRYDTDSYTAIPVRYQANCNLIMDIKRPNSSNTRIDFPVYDIIKKVWWGDISYLQKLFATEEDCMACSAPKIHRFV